MLWAWIATIVMAAFAGAGVKWAVDRVWPPPPRVIEIEVAPRRHGAGPRLTALDDTMDVLLSGYEAGKHARAESSVLERLGVPAGVALPGGGGWASGPCLDGPPAERPADWPYEIEEWVSSRPGQP